MTYLACLAMTAPVFTKPRSTVGDPQQNLSRTCSWNGTPRKKKIIKIKKSRFVDQSCLVLFLQFRSPKSIHLRN